MSDFHPSNEADLLLAANDDVQRALENIAPERWRHAAAGEWSVAEIVGHMIEMEPHWAEMAAAVAERPGTEVGRALDDAGRLGGPRSGAGITAREAAERLTAAGNEAADIVRAIAPPDAKKSGPRGALGTITVQQIVQQVLVAHAREHVQQILTALDAG